MNAAVVVAARAPRYRADTKGKLAVLKAECVDTMIGEMREANEFVLRWDDLTNTVREYAEYLTDVELAQCFDRAMRSSKPS